MVLKAGIVRYASVCNAIGDAIGAPRPACSIGAGRITLTFRGIGATRWPEERQIEHATFAAQRARDVLADNDRRDVRVRASRAIMVVYEDARVVGQCTIQGTWEVVVPAPSSSDGI